MSAWFSGGKPIRQLPLADRTVQYGDGLFETIAIRNGNPRLWRLHIKRLEQGCNRLNLLPPGRRELEESLTKAVAAAGYADKDATAKIIVSSGVSERGYARPMPTPTEVFIGLFATTPVAPELYQTGVDTIVCRTRLAAPSVTAGCKTLNRLEQVVARAECVAQGAFEGLTLDSEDRLICGTMSNVFMVTDHRIATPSLRRCGVAGVMRQHIVDVLQLQGTEVDVRDVRKGELKHADEIFLSNSQFGIVPVRRCDDRAWAVHTATRALMSVLAENGITECAG